MIYVTSDLHGYSPEKFDNLLSKAGFCDKDFCYVLGDVIDRGEYGVDLLQYLMNKPNFELIRGNHEEMLLDCLFLFDEVTDHNTEKLSVNDMHAFNTWLYNGGKTTIDSMYKLSKAERMDILDYISDTQLYAVLNVNGRDFILTHSGMANFILSKKMYEYNREDLLWNRPDLNTVYHKNIMTIFGHTPTILFGNEYKGKAYITDTWIDIDTGVAAGLDPCLLCLDTMKFYYTEDN